MPNRASELVWDEPEAAEPRGLTRAAIVEAAIEIADSEGLDAVSIRRVAAQLEARPMSLYTHIASKDDLLALMLNEVLGEVLVGEPLPGDWREAVGEIAARSYTAFLAHPWTLEAYGRSGQVVPNMVRHAEESAAAVSGLGLDGADTWTVLRIVDEYVLGHALRVLTSRRSETPDTVLVHFDRDEFPHLARLVGEDGLQLEPPAEAFDVGLEVVLDGIEKRFVSR